jgi:autotransporter-associated beta strand protein
MYHRELIGRTSGSAHSISLLRFGRSAPGRRTFAGGRVALSLGLLALMVFGQPQRLAAADAATDIVLTKNSLTVNKGTFVCNDDRLKTVPEYVIAGAFYSEPFVSPKFPCGGTLQIDPPTPATARLNPQAMLVFKGGYLFLDARKAAVAEQVKQIRFLSGMSEIRLENGGDAGGSTTLLAGDPANSLVRSQGATVMVGGDEPRSQAGFSKALGVAEKLLFASGMTAHLKGGGGPAGSTNRSIVPWMTGGTYLQPGAGGLVTYDREKGVHCLAPGEYDKKLQGTPDRNVWIDNVSLGDNKTQTVNACVFRPYYGMEIGAGSTLTITSGCLQFAGSGPSAIGFHPHKKNWLALAGTLNFGPAEGVIWSMFDTRYGPNIIGAVIAGSGGLTIAGSNTLILLNTNTYSGKTCVGSGTLQLGDVIPNRARLGNGDVEVAGGATLRIMSNVANGIPDTATVTLLHAGASFHGVMDLQTGVNETVAGLVLDGKAQPAGTYGSSASKATHKLDNYFRGPGILTVAARPGPAR